MDEVIRSWPNKDRAVHYREKATKLREMAESETSEAMREQLLVLSDEYMRLVRKLLGEQTAAD